MLPVRHQSLVLLVAVEVSTGQGGLQEPTAQWGCALPSTVGTEPLHPNELSKAEAEAQGSQGSS